MKILETGSETEKKVIIGLAGPDDFKILTKKRFSFVWKTVKKTTTVYKLQIEGSEDILMQYADRHLYLDGNNLIKIMEEYL